MPYPLIFKMKILFLDIDGVLNSVKFFNTLPHGFTTTRSDEILDPEAIERVNKIINETGAKIVVSSSWRIGLSLVELQILLKDHGITGDIIGMTPSLSFKGRRRGHEIQAWLNNHLEVIDFIILDDDSDMVHLMPALVKTSYQEGLLDVHVELAIKMLNEGYQLNV